MQPTPSQVFEAFAIALQWIENHAFDMSEEKNPVSIPKEAFLQARSPFDPVPFEFDIEGIIYCSDSIGECPSSGPYVNSSNVVVSIEYITVHFEGGQYSYDLPKEWVAKVESLLEKH